MSLRFSQTSKTIIKREGHGNMENFVLVAFLDVMRHKMFQIGLKSNAKVGQWGNYW